jgi:hypothetical protein
MGDEREQKVCERCGRRFASPDTLDAGRCPFCDGNLVPLDEGPYPDPPGEPEPP